MIERLRATLVEAGMLSQPGYEQLERDALQRVDDAVRFAEESPWPEGAEDS